MAHLRAKDDLKKILMEKKKLRTPEEYHQDHLRAKKAANESLKDFFEKHKKKDLPKEQNPNPD